MRVIFESFTEEKDRYRTRSYCQGGNWSDAEYTADPDIRPFLRSINQLPFAFCKWMSCSGSFNDHQRDGIYSLAKGANNHRFGVRVDEPQGYAVLRIDESHFAWRWLNKLLLTTPESLITPFSNNEMGNVIDIDETPHANTYTFQVFVPEQLRCPNPKDKEYMARIWKGLARKVENGEPADSALEDLVGKALGLD